MVLVRGSSDVSVSPREGRLRARFPTLRSLQGPLARINGPGGDLSRRLDSISVQAEMAPQKCRCVSQSPFTHFLSSGVKEMLSGCKLILGATSG